GRSNRMDRITELRPGQIRRELQRYMCASLPERVMIPASMRLRRCSEGVRRLIRCTARFNATWRGTFLGVAFTLPFLDPLVSQDYSAPDLIGVKVPRLLLALPLGRK